MIDKLFLSCLLTLAISPCFAQPVYRSTDKKGVVLYSTDNKVPESQAVDLPKIIKQPLKDQAGKNSYNKALSSCSAHGGINCSQGADSDGSVICYDGFKDSLQRFAFSCSRAKLTILDRSFKADSKSCSVVIRNESSVSAKNIEVASRNADKFQGPKEIAGYDSAEFSLQSPLKSVGEIKVNCDNC